MSTLYVDRRASELRLDAGRLRVYANAELAATLPVTLLDQVVVHGRTMIDSRLLSALAERGAGLVVLDPRNRDRTASLAAVGGRNGRRRIAQYASYYDSGWRDAWSRRLIRRKTRNQQRLLEQALHERPDKTRALRKALAALSATITGIDARERIARSSLRGIEGAAAAAYLAGYRELFAPSLSFLDRNRRPPRDPVNACLSLGYTLLHAQAVDAVRAASLDPMIGFYHDLAYGRESLACDVVEVLRPKIDGMVRDLFRDGELRPESFSINRGSCRLGKAGRYRFYAAYETRSPAVRRQLRRLLGLLCRNLDARDIHANPPKHDDATPARPRRGPVAAGEKEWRESLLDRT